MSLLVRRVLYGALLIYYRRPLRKIFVQIVFQIWTENAENELRVVMMKLFVLC